MHYNKPPISITDQVEKLIERGLIIDDIQKAESHLSRISFYRLRAYTFPFQDNMNPDHRFTKRVTFEQIVALYDFDHQLRILIFDALEKIEIAFRTQIIHNWAMSHGSHWHINPDHYRNPVKYGELITSLGTEISRGNEKFIEHYLAKYSIPPEPPSWMSLEVASFGLLSQIFQSLKICKEKKAVCRYFGILDVETMENWIYCFSSVRNICAHHGRLWNRRLTAHITMPSNPSHLFLRNRSIAPYKIHSIVSCMAYVMNIICPENTFRQDYIAIIRSAPFDERKALGMPRDIDSDPFWRV